jgi:hypothetical protein
MKNYLLLLFAVGAFETSLAQTTLTVHAIEKATCQALQSFSIKIPGKDTTIYGQTNDAGYCMIQVPAGVYQMTVRSPGYADWTQPVLIVGKNQSERLLVILVPDSTLSEDEILQQIEGSGGVRMPLRQSLIPHPKNVYVKINSYMEWVKAQAEFEDGNYNYDFDMDINMSANCGIGKGLEKKRHFLIVEKINRRAVMRLGN